MSINYEDYFPAAAGGSNIPYKPGRLYTLTWYGTHGSTASSSDRDYFFPITPTADCTLAAVAWRRDNGTFGTAYVGLYSSAGELLTDCAADSGTEPGWHAVPTTPVPLVAGEYYYLCINLSADIAGVMVPSFITGGNIDAGAINPHYIERAGFATEFGVAVHLAYKSRGDAPLLSTVTLSGGTPTINMPAMGFVVA